MADDHLTPEDDASEPSALSRFVTDPDDPSFPQPKRSISKKHPDQREETPKPSEPRSVPPHS
jgi:hypothetical protein